MNDTATVTRVAVELLRAYAPPRPVRLLGVRVAAFADADPAPVEPGQLTARALSALARGQDRPVPDEAEPLARWPA